MLQAYHALQVLFAIVPGQMLTETEQPRSDDGCDETYATEEPSQEPAGPVSVRAPSSEAVQSLQPNPIPQVARALAPIQVEAQIRALFRPHT